jgi:hypothetical protein
MIEILLDQINNLEFIFSIEGTNSPLKEICLTIMQPNYRLSFPGYLKDNKAIFTIPILNDLLKEGVYNYRIEVLVSDRHFIPLEDQLGIKKSTKVESVFSRIDKIETSSGTLKNEIDKHVLTPKKQIVIENGTPGNSFFLNKIKEFVEK